MIISNWDEAKLRKSKQGIIKLFDMPSKNLMFLMAKFASGEGLDLHSHDPPIEEIYFILEGKALVVVGEEKKEIISGTSVYIPPGKKHGISNVEKKELLVLFILSPPLK
jgi:mannose-6-phosphate isomerase-like protein (cupin superfamily)